MVTSESRAQRAPEYAYIWEFEVKPEMRSVFEQRYGPSGPWVELFKRSPDYLETLLLRDKKRSHRYVTIDRWLSEEAFRQFRKKHDAEYSRIDRECEGLTVRETDLGKYEPVNGPPNPPAV